MSKSYRSGRKGYMNPSLCCTLYNTCHQVAFGLMSCGIVLFCSCSHGRYKFCCCSCRYPKLTNFHNQLAYLKKSEMLSDVFTRKRWRQYDTKVQEIIFIENYLVRKVYNFSWKVQFPQIVHIQILVLLPLLLYHEGARYTASRWEPTFWCSM